MWASIAPARPLSARICTLGGSFILAPLTHDDGQCHALIPNRLSPTPSKSLTSGQTAWSLPTSRAAEAWLRHVSYYRLSAYRLYFEHPEGQAGPRFLPGTTFERVTALYDFDRLLRRLLMRGTEHVEVALRGASGLSSRRARRRAQLISTPVFIATAPTIIFASRNWPAKWGVRTRPISNIIGKTTICRPCRRYGWSQK